MALWHSYYLDGVYHYNISYRISENNGISWDPWGQVLGQNRPQPIPMTVSSSDSLVNIVIGTGVGDSAVKYGIRSTDFGMVWSAPLRIFAAIQGGWFDQTGHNSLVHLLWTGRFDMDHQVELYYTSSSNGGLDWSPSIPLSDTDQFHSQLPSIDADAAGALALTWMDYKYAPPGATGDIFLRESADSGQTWSGERQITFGHYSSLSDVERVGDTIHVVWEDESQGLDHWRIGYIRSTDGGQEWNEPQWVNRPDDDCRDPAVCHANGNAYVIWAVDQPTLDTLGIYFSRWPVEPDAIIGDNENNIPHSISLSAHPNPFNTATTITVGGTDDSAIEIFDSAGRRVAALHAESGRAVWEPTGLSSGIYFARAIKGQTGASAAQIIKLILMR
ncbi:MAG: hypothetical protein A2W25_12475 [candidate division Zixibacteria bacterium RBG_16_53_22]|nr:MAG: hypothetical protein A2W25_12475 [candidate division Zixibacteria bacterium RBG_16_53_22]